MEACIPYGHACKLFDSFIFILTKCYTLLEDTLLIDFDVKVVRMSAHITD